MALILWRQLHVVSILRSEEPVILPHETDLHIFKRYFFQRIHLLFPYHQPFPCQIGVIDVKIRIRFLAFFCPFQIIASRFLRSKMNQLEKIMNQFAAPKYCLFFPSSNSIRKLRIRNQGQHMDSSPVPCLFLKFFPLCRIL